MKRLKVEGCDMYISTKMIVINCNEQEYQTIKDFIYALHNELDVDICINEYKCIETTSGKEYTLECIKY